MEPVDLSPNDTPAWQQLLAPLPAEASVQRAPVAPPEVLAMPEGAAIAGWEHLTVYLSAGSAGLRTVLVTLDAEGRPISASDMVLYRAEISEGGETLTEYRHESLGGRLEADGRFLGTRWTQLTVEAEDEREVRKQATPSEPQAADVQALKALVAEVLRRAV